jgi:uroporphyrinogen-III synthase
MKHVLVVGPSVPASLAKAKDIEVIHKPCISLSPLDVDKEAMREKIALSDGILFTSKHAVSELVRHLKGEIYKQIPILSIGEETSKAAACYFSSFPRITASQPTQEGVFSCILEYKKERRLNHLFWPRSLHARHFLKDALTKVEISLFDFPLYVPTVVSQTYSFEHVDEILFTCPSSVMAFFSLIEKKEVAHLTLTPIGPITQKTLFSLLSA